MRSPCSGSARVRFGVDRDDALVLRARDPCAKLGCGPHDLVGRAVDRRARLLRPRGGEVSGRSRPAGRPWARAAREQGRPQRRAPLPPARLLLVPKAPRPGRPATPRDRRSAGPARSTPMSTPQISATRRVSVVSSIALQKDTSRLPSSSGVASASSGVSTGTSRSRVTSCFDTRMSLTVSGLVSASRRFGCLISPARASSVSRSPYSVMS